MYDPLSLKRTLSFLILGQKGGQNRVRIIQLLEERPYNTNQLAEIMGVNYRTIKHHVSVLQDHEIISPSRSGEYGKVYFLRPHVEENIDIFHSIKTKFKTSRKLSDFTTSPQFFKNVIEQTKDAVVIINEEGEAFFWNRSAEELTGFTKEEVLGDELSIFPKKKIREKMIARVKEGTLVSGEEIVIKGKERQDLDISITMDAIKDDKGGVIGFSLFMRDIRDRKTAEARASYFNQLLTSILQISQAIIHTDNPGELFQKCCEILYENRKYMDVRMFLMLDSGKPRLICHHGSGHECEEDHGSEEDVSISSPPCIIEVIEKGSIKLIENTSEHCSDCGCCRHDRDHQSIIVPMKHREGTIGAMNVCLETGYRMDPEELNLLEEVASDLAFGIEKIRVERELKSMSACR